MTWRWAVNHRFVHFILGWTII